MACKSDFFLSDFHLGAGYLHDPKAVERRVVAFLDSIKYRARTVYLLGDILDYWYEYRYVVPRGFVRFFGKIAELTDMGVRVVWFIGNHDIWIFDYLPSELGVEVVDGSRVECIDGRKFYLAHGDGVGKRPADFRFIRSLFRNRICQKLYSGIHPRWTIPFALGWSRHSRMNESAPDFDPAKAPVVEFARDYSLSHPDIEWFIFGHLHVEAQLEISPTCRLVLLGEWMHKCSYAEWDGMQLTLKRFIQP